MRRSPDPPLVCPDRRAVSARPGTPAGGKARSKRSRTALTAAREPLFPEAGAWPAGDRRMRRLEQAQDAIRWRRLDAARRLGAGSGARCREDSRLLYSSGLGSTRSRNFDPGGLRACRRCRRIHPVRDGCHVDRCEVIRRQGLRGGSANRGALGGRGSSTGNSHGERVERRRLDSVLVPTAAKSFGLAASATSKRLSSSL